MDAFVSRKKRKISPLPDTIQDINNLVVLDDDESTDFKLAMLASLHPGVEQQSLLDILLAQEGSVEAASTALSSQNIVSEPRKSFVTAGYQSSLSGFANTASSAKKAKLMSRKGKTLHLYSPEDIASNTPCSLIHSFLDPKDANLLLEELLVQAPTFERMTFKLFDNVVTSPHTACFYVENKEEQIRQKTEYIYNGDLLTDVRQISPHMRRISAKVGEAVNMAIRERIKTHYPDGKKLKYQSPHLWSPNAAFVNCYAGGAEAVGYHSDQLTYLGPRAVIGSLSLGVAREFRVRRIVPQESDSTDSITLKTKSKEHADAEGQISIHLPHNSLLVMHAEMQEEWKHSIAPAQAIDPHPIAGNKRINITYRDYKSVLHPKFTPKCHCGIPTVLRVVQRKKENLGRYFWMCHAGNVPGKDGCAFFEWAVFDDDGNPVWKKLPVAKGEPSGQFEPLDQLDTR